MNIYFLCSVLANKFLINATIASLDNRPLESNRNELTKIAAPNNTHCPILVDLVTQTIYSNQQLYYMIIRNSNLNTTMLILVWPVVVST